MRKKNLAVTGDTIPSDSGGGWRGVERIEMEETKRKRDREEEEEDGE